MNKLFLVISATSTLLFFASPVLASTPTAGPGDSCSIEAQTLYCGAAAPALDAGCSVSCQGDQKAVCQPATSFELPSPNGPGQCDLISSACYCN